MLEDTLEIEEDEELEEEADAEVDKVLFELTDGKLGLVGPVGTGLPVSPTLELSNGWADIFVSRLWKAPQKTKRQSEIWNNIANNLMVYSVPRMDLCILLLNDWSLCRVEGCF
jgi:hypothetical protein